MKILLIGEFPPPHGGISVHVAERYRELTSAGHECHLLDTRRSSAVRFAASLAWHALRRWTLHVHTNGHNPKSWLVALACALAGRLGTGAILTLHSGLVPSYLSTVRRRRLARMTCALCTRIVCVSNAIQQSILSLGVPPSKTGLAPAWVDSAWIDPARPQTAPPPDLDRWMNAHRPLFTTALFFRPEYGFDVLIAALAKLRSRYPSLGCLIMGSGENQSDASDQVRDANLENNILLLGDVAHDTCLAFMSRSDAFIRPTLVDGDSISVREALYLGVPVVASRVGSRPPGPILFTPGDVDDLAAKLNAILAVQRDESPAMHHDAYAAT